MVSITAMLKSSRAVAVDHLEELAARLAAGEGVAPEEVTVVLDRLRATEEDLQRAVDRQIRVAELRREISDAATHEKRLTVIEAAWQAAEADVAKAKTEYNTLLVKYTEEHMTCRHRLDAIDWARRALVAEENLPPSQANRLRAVRQLCDELSDSLATLTNTLTDRRARLRRAKELLPAVEEQAKLYGNNATVQAEAERLRNAVASRGVLVAEAERAVADTQRRHEKAITERNKVEREVATAAALVRR